MRQTSIGFKSNGLNLEGIVSVPDDGPGPFPTVVICHSHPALSGNMGNKIVKNATDTAPTQVTTSQVSTIKKLPSRNFLSKTN